MNRRGRANGEGTVCRRKDGRWIAALNVAVDDSGKPIRRTVYAKTQREALEKLRKLRADADDGVPADAGRATLGEYLERWLEDAVRPSVAPSTWRVYSGLVRNHIAPVLGGQPLGRLSPQHLQHLQAEMERRGASPRLRQMVYVVLRTALAQALKWQLISRNPCDAVPRPRAPRKEIRYLDADEARRLLAAAEGDRLEALCVVAVSTGMRQGELLGLQWGDVDFENSMLTVRRQLLESPDGSLDLGQPKSARSRRSVALPEVALAALRKHRERSGTLPLPSALVFTDTRGGPLRKSNLIRRWFCPLLERAGLPRIRFHDLRHTHATLLLVQGVNPKVVQERLGHSQIAITLDTYSHVSPNLQREAAHELDAALSLRVRE